MILAEGAAEASADTFTGLMDHMGQGFEALGAAILVVGFYLVLRARSGGCAAIRLVAQGLAVLRQAFGATCCSGLEVLVAADLVCGNPVARVAARTAPERLICVRPLTGPWPPLTRRPVLHVIPVSVVEPEAAKSSPQGSCCWQRDTARWQHDRAHPA